jgi:hypothetical protein
MIHGHISKSLVGRSAGGDVVSTLFDVCNLINCRKAEKAVEDPQRVGKISKG